MSATSAPLVIMWPGAAGLTVRVHSAEAHDACLFTRFRFVTTQTRDPASKELQLAQLILYDENGLLIPLCNAKNLFGSNPSNEEPSRLIDGNKSTKWLDSNKV